MDRLHYACAAGVNCLTDDSDQSWVRVDDASLAVSHIRSTPCFNYPRHQTSRILMVETPEFSRILKV